jgi:hypothetical protein
MQNIHLVARKHQNHLAHLKVAATKSNVKAKFK